MITNFNETRLPFCWGDNKAEIDWYLVFMTAYDIFECLFEEYILHIFTPFNQL